MVADKDIIVAIELGSTSIRGIAGQREPDGSMQILAVEQEHATGSIRKGIVDNIDKTSQAISHIVSRLNERLGAKINRVYVGLSGQSLHTCRNSVARQFDMKVLITHEIVDGLKDTNLGFIYPDASILDVATQEYRVGIRSVDEPIGMQSDHIEGHFVNVIARTTLTDNIERCVRNAGLELADVPITPIALADSILSNSEKRSGCALVDMGAETTTVAVYTNNILRHLCVIPLGGNNITMDIASQNIEMEEAEMLKRKYGTAYNNNLGDGASHKINISYERTIEESTLQDIVEARTEEIITNVWEQIKEYGSELLSGVILTGSAARLNNMEEAFKKYSKCENLHIRFAKALPTNSVLAPGITIPEDLCANALVSILMQGDLNCIAPEEPVEEEPEEPVTPVESEPATPVEVVVEPEAEEPKEQEEEPKEPKENKRSWRDRFKNFGKTVSKILDEGEDD